MADNEDIILTRDDCVKISNYIQWLEEKVEAEGYDVGKEFLKVEKSVEKIMDV